MLPLPEGQTGEAWEPSKKQCSVGNAGAWGRQVLALFLQSSLVLYGVFIGMFLKFL